MNDFSEIESELKELRPHRPSPQLSARIEQAMNDLEIARGKIIRPNRFRATRAALGFGVAAAAAVIFLLVRVSTDRMPKQAEKIAQLSALPEAKHVLSEAEGSTLSGKFIPAGATQVVYNTRMEGLQFADGSEEPMRRVRYQTHETLRWQNPGTGASLRVSYPSEEIVLIPISGQ